MKVESKMDKKITRIVHYYEHGLNTWQKIKLIFSFFIVGGIMYRIIPGTINKICDGDISNVNLLPVIFIIIGFIAMIFAPLILKNLFEQKKEETIKIKNILECIPNNRVNIIYIIDKIKHLDTNAIEFIADESLYKIDKITGAYKAEQNLKKKTPKKEFNDDLYNRYYLIAKEYEKQKKRNPFMENIMNPKLFSVMSI